jgi:uncharacterized lipoprotein YehR (DUF1307 family)
MFKLKSILLVIASVATLSLVACGDKDEEDSSATTESTTESTTEG